MPSSMRPRALILFPGALGDFICLLPTVERLCQQSKVEILARTDFADLVPFPVTVGSLERDEINRLFVPGAGKIQRLRSFFDSYASIYSWFGSGQPVFVDEMRRAAQGSARVFPFRPLRAGVHQIDYYLSCVHETPGAVPAVSVKPEARAWCDGYWRQHALEKKPMLALAPGSGAREKNWPLASYRALAAWWREKFQGVVILVLGPVEDERGVFDSIGRDALVARGLTLGQLSALLSRCLLYVGNDSGTTHLAAALGVRTVALFGPSDPRQWAPHGARVTLVRNGVECSPCPIATMKSCTHRDCLVILEPNAVIDTLESLPELATLTRREAEIRV